MPQFNPTKEFSVPHSIDHVRDSILKLNETEPKYYVLVSDNKSLGQIRIHQKGALLDMGYHIDFTLHKISDQETKVSVEISRNAGAINTAAEMSIANNSMKSVTDKFGAFLDGNVDATGKPNLPKPSGCVIFGLIFLGATIYYYL